METLQMGNSLLEENVRLQEKRGTMRSQPGSCLLLHRDAWILWTFSYDLFQGDSSCADCCWDLWAFPRMSSHSAHHKGKRWNDINITLGSESRSKCDRIYAKKKLTLDTSLLFSIPFSHFFWLCHSIFNCTSTSVLLGAKGEGAVSSWRGCPRILGTAPECREDTSSSPQPAHKGWQISFALPETFKPFPISPQCHRSCLQMGFADVLWFPRTFLRLSEQVRSAPCAPAHARARTAACLLPNSLICQSQFLQPAISITFKWNPCWPW